MANSNVAEPKSAERVAQTTLPGDKRRGYTFFGSMFDYAAVGYVEEEWFFEGTANRYRSPSREQLASRTEVEPGIESGGHAYRSRMVVRRPIQPARGNGTVIVEWQNVTAGYDLEALWAPSWQHVVREGYAWVGVSAQRVGVEHLKGWSPDRYGVLDVTEGGETTDDSLCYDVFAQAIQLCRNPSGPLANYPVDQVLAIGASQSAGRLVAYMNYVLPVTGPVFEGLGLIVGGGNVRIHPEIPVFVVLSETDVQRRAATDRPDPEGLRRWEIAGASHSAYAGFSSRLIAANRDVGPTGIPDCDRNPYSRVPGYQVFNAAYDHLARWAAGGAPPPVGPRMEYESVDPPVLARDELGIVKGGIRLADVEVPVAVNTGVNSGDAFCRLYGSHDPLDADTLAKLYPTHDDYVDRVIRVTNANLRAGYLTPADAADTRRAAALSDVGR